MKSPKGCLSKLGGAFKRGLGLCPLEKGLGLKEGRFRAHPYKSHMAISRTWGLLLCASLYIIRVLLLGVHISAPDVWKLPNHWTSTGFVSTGVRLGASFGCLFVLGGGELLNSTTAKWRSKYKNSIIMKSV